jgi:hypothetical protein
MTKEEKLAIWHRMTPERRDYDRLVARRIPQGASWTPETNMVAPTEREYDDDRGCSCHISAPCGWCVEQSDDGSSHGG